MSFRNISTSTHLIVYLCLASPFIKGMHPPAIPLYQIPGEYQLLDSQMTEAPPSYEYFATPAHSPDIHTLATAPEPITSHELLAHPTRIERIKLIRSTGLTRAVSRISIGLSVGLLANTIKDIFILSAQKGMTDGLLTKTILADCLFTLGALFTSVAADAVCTGNELKLIDLLRELDNMPATQVNEERMHPAYTRYNSVLGQPYIAPHSDEAQLSQLHKEYARSITCIQEMGSHQGASYMCSIISLLFMLNGFKDLIMYAESDITTATIAASTNVVGSLAALFPLMHSSSRARTKKTELKMILNELDGIIAQDEEA